MKLSKIREFAIKAGIPGVAAMEKPELIHTIQVKEGNHPCFNPGTAECVQTDCLWREDCVK